MGNPRKWVVIGWLSAVGTMLVGLGVMLALGDSQYEMFREAAATSAVGVAEWTAMQGQLAVMVYVSAFMFSVLLACVIVGYASRSWIAPSVLGVLGFIVMLAYRWFHIRRLFSLDTSMFDGIIRLQADTLMRAASGATACVAAGVLTAYLARRSDVSRAERERWLAETAASRRRSPEEIAKARAAVNRSGEEYALRDPSPHTDGEQGAGAVRGTYRGERVSITCSSCSASNTPSRTVCINCGRPLVAQG